MCLINQSIDECIGKSHCRCGATFWPRRRAWTSPRRPSRHTKSRKCWRKSTVVAWKCELSGTTITCACSRGRARCRSCKPAGSISRWMERNTIPATRKCTFSAFSIINLWLLTDEWWSPGRPISLGARRPAILSPPWWRTYRLLWRNLQNILKRRGASFLLRLNSKQKKTGDIDSTWEMAVFEFWIFFVFFSQIPSCFFSNLYCRFLFNLRLERKICRSLVLVSPRRDSMLFYPQMFTHKCFPCTSSLSGLDFYIRKDTKISNSMLQ